VDIWIDDVKIVSNGQGESKEKEQEASDIMARDEFTLTIDLNLGDHEDYMLTCDLTHGYIDINATYRT
jgi:glutamate N-acetyltransferase/amino-acid N-acetyltransferase